MTTQIDRLLHIMARLRDPDGGCPWDIEQTPKSIAPHTIEEAYEVVDAVERDDMAALKDELGDLLFHVVYYSQMTEEAGLFAFDDVVEGICDKMISRHPHVFGDVEIGSATAQTVAWEETKARERKAKNGGSPTRLSALDGVAATLPALTHAYKLQRRAARVGFDWDDAAGVIDKIKEEADETAETLNASRDEQLDELGDLLFSCVNLARKLDIEPETALRAGNRKFEKRFRAMETMVTADGSDLKDKSLDDMDAAWNRVKGGA